MIIIYAICQTGTRAATASKPIHRRVADDVQVGVQQGHPVQRLAADQGQVAQVGHGAAGRLGGGLRQGSGFGAARDQFAQRLGPAAQAVLCLGPGQPPVGTQASQAGQT